MREYKKETRTYQHEITTKCICDHCGKECDISNEDFEEYSSINVSPRFTETNTYFQLCVDCTNELLDFFNKGVKEEVDDLKDDIKIALDLKDILKE